MGLGPTTVPQGGKKWENCVKLKNIFLSNLKQLQPLEFSVHVLFKLAGRALNEDSCECIKADGPLVKQSQFYAIYMELTGHCMFMFTLLCRTSLES